jgi:hypothetical protein
VRTCGDSVDLPIAQGSHGARRRAKELDVRLQAFGSIISQLLGGEGRKVGIGYKVWHGDAHGAS